MISSCYCGADLVLPRVYGAGVWGSFGVVEMKGKTALIEILAEIWRQHNESQRGLGHLTVVINKSPEG